MIRSLHRRYIVSFCVYTNHQYLFTVSLFLLLLTLPRVFPNSIMRNTIVMFLRRSRCSLDRMFQSRPSLSLVTEPCNTGTWIMSNKHSFPMRPAQCRTGHNYFQIIANTVLANTRSSTRLCPYAPQPIPFESNDTHLTPQCARGTYSESGFQDVSLTCYADAPNNIFQLYQGFPSRWKA